MSPSEYEQLVEFLGRQFTDIDRRFDRVDGQIAELQREMLGHFDEIYRRLERLEQEYQAITPGAAPDRGEPRRRKWAPRDPHA